MIKQSDLNLLVDIIPEKRAQLDSVLLKYQQEDWKLGPPPAFTALNTVHFLRCVVMEEMLEKDKTYPARLFFESNFDGDSSDQHIADLCTKAGDWMDSIFENCVGYPTGKDAGEKARFLISKSFKSEVFYNSSPLRNLDRIRQEDRLRESLWDILNSSNNSGKTQKQIVEFLQQEIKKNPALNWAQQKAPMPHIFIPGLILTLVIILAALPLLIVLLLVLRFFYERKMVPLGLLPGEVSQKHMETMEYYEDHVFQNQFSQVLYLNTSLIRRITLKMVMLFTRALGGWFFVKGELMGIPTIHFARWVVMDKGRHMMFTSNFDGSWQQYLGDFIDKSGWGLTAIWSNSEGFPKTYFLFAGGAYNEQQFLAWSRYYQIPTQYWYSAYPDLSIKNVNNNSKIRRDLFKNMSEKQAAKFLNRL